MTTRNKLSQLPLLFLTKLGSKWLWFQNTRMKRPFPSGFFSRCCHSKNWLNGRVRNMSTLSNPIVCLLIYYIYIIVTTSSSMVIIRQEVWYDMRQHFLFPLMLGQNHSQRPSFGDRFWIAWVLHLILTVYSHLQSIIKYVGLPKSLWILRAVHIPRWIACHICMSPSEVMILKYELYEHIPKPSLISSIWSQWYMQQSLPLYVDVVFNLQRFSSSISIYILNQLYVLYLY